MAFRYPMAVPEDDGKAHIRKIHVDVIDQLITNYRGRKPLLDHRKKSMSEDASEKNLWLMDPGAWLISHPAWTVQRHHLLHAPSGPKSRSPIAHHPRV
jgi:hypothetical protein